MLAHYQTFLRMGGYALYVWLSYGIVFSFFTLYGIFSFLKLKRLQHAYVKQKATDTSRDQVTFIVEGCGEKGRKN